MSTKKTRNRVFEGKHQTSQRALEIFVTIRVVLGELSKAGSSIRHQPVDGERREGSLSAFRFYRLSRKDFRPARCLPEPLRFERESPGSGRNSPGSPRTPKLSRQNSQSLWLPPPEKLPTRFLLAPRCVNSERDRKGLLIERLVSLPPDSTPVAPCRPLWAPPRGVVPPCDPISTRLS